MTTLTDEPNERVKWIVSVISGEGLNEPLLPGSDWLMDIHPNAHPKQIEAANSDPYGVRLLLEVEAFLEIEWRSIPKTERRRLRAKGRKVEA